jgi:16S rRNA G1207 methylase RsmC
MRLVKQDEERKARKDELQKKGRSCAPVDLKENIPAVIARMKAAKPEVMNRLMNLLKRIPTKPGPPGLPVCSSGFTE